MEPGIQQLQQFNFEDSAVYTGPLHLEAPLRSSDYPRMQVQADR